MDRTVQNTFNVLWALRYRHEQNFDYQLLAKLLTVVNDIKQPSVEEEQYLIKDIVKSFEPYVSKDSLTHEDWRKMVDLGNYKYTEDYCRNKTVLELISAIYEYQERKADK